MLWGVGRPLLLWQLYLRWRVPQPLEELSSVSGGRAIFLPNTKTGDARCSLYGQHSEGSLSLSPGWVPGPAGG